MKDYIKFFALILATFGFHYFFIGVIRSELYTYIMLGSALLAVVIAAVAFIACITERSEKAQIIGSMCGIYMLITTLVPFTEIGVADKTKLFTIQMTYNDGYTETATYELPEDAEIYLYSRGRYSSGTDLEYRNFPFHGGLIQNNIVRYKIVSIKDK